MLPLIGVKAITARDVDRTVAHCAGGGSYLPNPPSNQQQSGRASRILRPSAFPAGAGLTCDTTKVEGARSVVPAYEIGTCKLDKKDSGKPSTEKQNCVLICKKQADGAWRAAVDIDNTN
jgi:ketosteroid isomerase-like protein